MRKKYMAVLAGVLVALAPQVDAGGLNVPGDEEVISPDDVGMLPDQPDDPDADPVPAPGQGAARPANAGLAGAAHGGGAGGASTGAAADASGAAVPELVGGPADWIKQLGHESFAVREAASNALWRRGGEVLGLLAEAEKSGDPEVAFRARELIRKVRLGVGPETPEPVRLLVEEYSRGDVQKKLGIISRLLREKAYKQVLLLYGMEKDEQARNELLELVKEVAPAAARQAILDGQFDEARTLLEMAPVDDRGLANLAAFHRARGTLQEELKRAAGVAGERGLQWRLALHRAAGDIDAALADAQALNRKETVAGLLLLKGNPVPWLELQSTADDLSVFHHLYLEAAVQRWKTHKVEPRVLDEMVNAARKDEDNLSLAVEALLALGETKRAEALMKLCPQEIGFEYYDQAERVDEALEALGLDLAAPDFDAWAAKHAEAITPDDLDESSKPMLLMAEFLSRRGDSANLQKVLGAMFKKLRKLDQPDYLLGMLATLHATGCFEGILDEVENYAKGGANPREVEGRWAEVVEVFYSDDPVVQSWWSYLGAGDPAMPLRERLRTLDALLGRSRHPELATPWVERRWKEAQKAAGAERDSAIEMLVRVTCPLLSRMDRVDMQLGLKVLAELPKDQMVDGYARLYLHMLTVNGQWKEAAKLCREFIKDQPARFDFGQELAMILRKAGSPKEADEWQRRAELLALGHPTLLLTMAASRQHGGDHQGGAEYLRQILIENDPSTPGWIQAISGVALDLSQVSGLAEYEVQRRAWELAAPLSEVVVFNALNMTSMYGRTTNKLVFRINADLALGMKLYKSGDQKNGLEILQRAGQVNPGQGALADEYFPALREAKLGKLHDEMFELSWAHLQHSLERFPNADNTHNTLAWLASRAARRLDAAAEHAQRALQLFPGQPAYLDTHAEVWFAKRNRAKAVELSEQAVAALPIDAQLQRQRERFRKAEFPVP